MENESSINHSTPPDAKHLLADSASIKDLIHRDISRCNDDRCPTAPAIDDFADDGEDNLDDINDEDNTELDDAGTEETIPEPDKKTPPKEKDK